MFKRGKMFSDGGRWVYTYEDTLIDACAMPRETDLVNVMRHESDGEIYGFQCIKCSSSWKIYQRRKHYENCKD